MERGREGPTIRRGRVGLRAEQGHLEGRPLRRGEGVESLVDDPVEEISEGREGELRLGLGGPRRESSVGAGSGLCQGVEPQSTLADARFASEDQGLRPRNSSSAVISEVRTTGSPAGMAATGSRWALDSPWISTTTFTASSMRKSTSSRASPG